MNIKYGNSFRDHRFKTKIEWALNYSIRKSTRDIGREYYVLNKLFEKDFIYNNTDYNYTVTSICSKKTRSITFRNAKNVSCKIYLQLC